MAVPPPSQPSSTPSSQGDDNQPTQGKKTKKDFTLPTKGKKDEGDQKKKNLFDIAGSVDQEVKELKQDIQDSKMMEAQEASSIQGSQAKASVQAISRLIQNVVAEMRVGQIDGKDFTSMNLSTTSADIPEAFSGSNLTLSYQANALVIHFDNFMTPQQENNAITLVEKNKEQLLEMVQTLQAKNINIQEMSIGKHIVSLPRVETLPPPFQPTEAGSAETRQDREQQREGGEEGAGPE